MSKRMPKRCLSCNLQDRGKGIHQCPRPVDLNDDDITELGELLSVRCRVCNQFSSFEQSKVRTFRGKAFLTGPCQTQNCRAVIEVQIVGWVCSGGGDLGPPASETEHLTRSGRGPRPGRLPGY